MSYDYLAPIFAYWAHKPAADWRKEMLSQCQGRVLEIGVGAGNNLPLYTIASEVVAIDTSPGMLKEAAKLQNQAIVPVQLVEMDVQELKFEPASFDTVVATFVFCSVADPVQSFREIRRVLRTDGRVVVVEHVLSHKLAWRTLLYALKPPLKTLAGCDPTRKTVDNMVKAGLEVQKIRPLLADVVLQIEASP